MHIRSKSDVQNPLFSPLGEILYELVGIPAQSGSAQTHSLAQVTCPPGKRSAEHHHLTAEETYYLLSGEARMVVDGVSFDLHAGQALLIKPGERHQLFNESEQWLEFLVICAPPWVADDSVY
jgi:mannose-6-phosphate isomerase-like protein (cupin superfamily)